MEPKRRCSRAEATCKCGVVKFVTAPKRLGDMLKFSDQTLEG